MPLDGERFDGRTFIERFSGPNRKAELRHTGPSPTPCGGWVTFDNGWTISIQWGPYMHGSNYNLDLHSEVPPALTAEVAVWHPKIYGDGGGIGRLIRLQDDNIAGYQPMSHVLAALDAAARDDQEGIVKALVSDDES